VTAATAVAYLVGRGQVAQGGAVLGVADTILDIGADPMPGFVGD
jgi:hypothetical protein